MTEQIARRPGRVQLSRRAGAHLPPNTINVARPSRWGNPFILGVHAHDNATAVRLFADYLTDHPWLITEARAELAGKNLACWCAPTAPCHADVLLRVANFAEAALPVGAGGRPHGAAGAHR